MNCDVHTVNILVETKFYLSTACSYNQYIIQQVQLENALVGLLKKTNSSSFSSYSSSSPPQGLVAMLCIMNPTVDLESWAFQAHSLGSVFISALGR